MENKEKIVELFPVLYTDMEILSGYDQTEVRQSVRDFMVLVSRACAEAGLEAELAQQMLRQDFHPQFRSFLRSLCRI